MAKKHFLTLLADALVAKGASIGQECNMVRAVAYFQVNAAGHEAEYEQALIRLWADGVLNNTWPWTV